MDNRETSEKFLNMLESFGVMVLLSYFFYRSIWAMLPLVVVGVFFYRSLKKKYIRKKLEQLDCQFKECILSVSTSLKAGYAVENAFSESERDMKQLYGENSMIVTELEIIRRGLVMNVPLEDLLNNLAERSGSEHIIQFSQVFAIAKRAGGNMPEIIRTTANLIGRNIDSREEMKTIISGRRMEQNIMKLMPFAMVLYVGFTSKGYFDSLYGNLSGTAIMTACLIVYLAAYFLGEHILDKLER